MLNIPASMSVGVRTVSLEAGAAGERAGFDFDFDFGMQAEKVPLCSDVMTCFSVGRTTPSSIRVTVRIERRSKMSFR